MISIVIPHHTEDKDKIKPLMTSLDQQVGINFNNIEVLLCCDVEKSPLDDYNFSEYPNIMGRIRKLKSPYRTNPGMSRQLGIDECIGDYVLFCDSDDSLYNLGVLRELQENINHSHADVYRFRFMEECGDPNSPERTYSIKQHNWTWVFSQAYNVEFLRQNNIRFSRTLRWHEDSYFNLILRYCAPKVIDIESIAYLWRYSDTSITRADNHAYSFTSMDEFFDAISQGFRVILRQYGKNCFSDILVGACKGFFWLQNPSSRSRFQDDIIYKCEKRYYEYIKEFIPQVIEVGTDTRQIDSDFTKIFYMVGGEFIPEKPWKVYIAELKEKFDK